MVQWGPFLARITTSNSHCVRYNLHGKKSSCPTFKNSCAQIRHESFVPLSVSHNVFCRLQYLIVAKGEVLLAVILNPLLYAFRGPRNVLGFITSRISGQTSPDSTVDFDLSKKDASSNTSAKERVLRKWGSE